MQPQPQQFPPSPPSPPSVVPVLMELALSTAYLMRAVAQRLQQPDQGGRSVQPAPQPGARPLPVPGQGEQPASSQNPDRSVTSSPPIQTNPAGQRDPRAADWLQPGAGEKTP